MTLFKMLCLLPPLLVWLQPGWAAGITEEQIKASYVVNFAKFVEWPDGVPLANSKITLCVIGSSVLDEALLALEGRKAGDHELLVIQHIDLNENLHHCQLVFISQSEQHKFVAFIKALGDASVLTISDIADFAEKGGDIGLLYHENKIVFEVNLASLLRTKLYLPSQVLNIATHVFNR